jgi:hypothetical protein
MSFVYVISNEIYAKNNIYKIGKADNVKTRLTILNKSLTGTPAILKEYASFECVDAFKIEGRLHNYFMPHRYAGEAGREWFQVSLEEIERVAKQFIKEDYEIKEVNMNEIKLIAKAIAEVGNKDKKAIVIKYLQLIIQEKSKKIEEINLWAAKTAISFDETYENYNKIQEMASNTETNIGTKLSDRGKIVFDLLVKNKNQICSYDDLRFALFGNNVPKTRDNGTEPWKEAIHSAIFNIRASLNLKEDILISHQGKGYELKG